MLQRRNCSRKLLAGLFLTSATSYIFRKSLIKNVLVIYNHIKEKITGIHSTSQQYENISRNIKSLNIHDNCDQDENSTVDDVEDIIDFSLNNGHNFSRKDMLNNETLDYMKSNVVSMIHFNKNKTVDSRKETNSIIPGTQCIFVKTYGCSHNNSDSEVMMGLLSAYGYGFTNKLEESDICLINSCTVKSPSQSSFLAMVNSAKALGIPVVVAGCVPQGQQNIKDLQSVSIIGLRQITRVVEVIEETLKGHIVQLLDKGPLPSLDIPKIRKNKYVEIIPISSGCLGSCTYCKTKHARGHLGSYQTDEILNRVKSVSEEDVTEIWFTSEDVGAYGLDIKTNIVNLMRDTLQLLESIYKEKNKYIMLRIGMTNPPYILNAIHDIAVLLNHPHCFKFIHIPVQSGSNKVLFDMRREYTKEEFCYLVEELKENVPNITIATDIICGFPTEDDEDHEESLALIRLFKFPILNISQFYSRPNTPAASMKQLQSQVIKERSSEVTNLFYSYECFQYLLNTNQKVSFTSIEKNVNQMVGHTEQYVKVIVPVDMAYMGKYCTVHITKVDKWHVEGYII